MKCAPVFAHGWFERKSECRDSGKQAIHTYELHKHFFFFFLASKSLRTDQETKDVVLDWLKGLLLRHFICTLYFCFNIELYIVLNFVTFSCSANSTGFILIGIPKVSLFFNGPHHIKWHDLFKSLPIHNFDTRWNWVYNTHYFQHLKHCYHRRDHAIRHAHQEYSVIFQQILSKNDLPLPWTKYFPLLYTKFVPSKTTEICERR